MSSLADAFAPAKQKTADGKTLDSLIRKITVFGRLGKSMLFDPPGVTPITLRYEVLDDDEEKAATVAAYKYVVKTLGDELRGPVEDTKLYDNRLLKETLFLSVKRTDIQSDGGYYYPAAMSVDEFGKFTPEQLTYMFNQYQLVRAEFTPSKAQQLLMSGVENFAKKCAEAIESNEDENRFLFLASLSWPDLIMLVATLGAHLHDFLVPSTTQSSSQSTSGSESATSDQPTDSSTESQLSTSTLLDRSSALQLVTQQRQDSSSRSEAATLDPQPTSDEAANELAGLLKP